jgi:hypothetical protein
MYAEPAGLHNSPAVRDHREVRGTRAGAQRRQGQRLRRRWAESRDGRRQPHRGRRAKVVRLVRWATALLSIAGLVAALVFRSWVAAQTRAVIVLSRTSNTPVVSWLCGVRKSDPQAARLYSWMSPPRRSVRRSWCRGDAFTSQGVVVFGSGGVRSSDLCGLWPL